MSRWSKMRSVALLAALTLAMTRSSVEAASHDTDGRIDALLRRAREGFRSANPDSQRIALEGFEEAVAIMPSRQDLWLEFGQACLRLGRISRARACLSKAAFLASDNSDVWCSLGMTWKRDWLMTLDRGSLRAARECMNRAAAVSPERVDAWTASASLSLLMGKPGDALLAASRARRTDPQNDVAIWVQASAFYRSSALSYADTAFQTARRLLPPELRNVFELNRFAEPYEQAANASTLEGSSFDWSDSDPDLTTAENEAQLDYLTRLTLALFLFRDGDGLHWARRAALFGRYGPPCFVEFSPAGAQVGESELAYRFPRRASVGYAPPPIPYPYHLQIWHYPDLGLNVEMWDRNLTGNYQFPPVEDGDPDPRPDPGLLGARPDLMALADGRGVFRVLPLGTRP